MKVRSESEVAQSCPTLSDPMNCSLQAPPSMGFSRQEYWSGVPFPSPCMKVRSESGVAQSCPTLSDPMDCSLQAPPSMGFSRQKYWSGVPFPSPCMKVKSEREKKQFSHF